MSRTVCSWCKAPLVLKDDILVCGNTDCPACDEKYLHEELIRAKKQLEIYHGFVTKLYLNGNITDESLIRLQKLLYIQTKG